MSIETYAAAPPCERCGELPCAQIVDVMDKVITAHVCRRCQDECRAYYPCLVCGWELADLGNYIGSRYHFCPDCIDKIRRLLAMGKTPLQISGVAWRPVVVEQGQRPHLNRRELLADRVNFVTTWLQSRGT